MKVSSFLLVGFAAILTPFLVGQEPEKPLPETRIVLRISGKLIQALLGERFERDEPIDENVRGVAVAGTAHVVGKLHVLLRESESESNFDVLIRGEVRSQLAATRPPVVVLAHGAAPFSICQPIVHQDHQFMVQPLTMEVRNRFTLDEICSDRTGLTGALTRRIALPFVRRGLVEGDSVADEEIRVRMSPVVKAEMGKLVDVMNRIPPLVKQAYAVVILENKVPKNGERFYRAATKDYLLISIGAENRRMPSLPNLDKNKQAPLELWIGVAKNAGTEDRRKFLIENWRFVAPFLTAQFQRRSPELTKGLEEPLSRLLEEVQVHEVPGWHVLTFAPRIPLPVPQAP